MVRDLILYLCSAIPSSISLISTSIVLFLYLRYSQLHYKSFTTIVILCILDSTDCISLLIPYTLSKSHYILCQIQGMLIEFSMCASVLWIGKICLIIVQDTFKANLNLYKNLFKSLAFVIIISIIIACLPFTFSGYEYVSGHCWVSGKTHEDKILRALVFFLPLVIITILSGVALIASAYRISNNSSKKMIYYALILVIGYIPVFTARFLQIFSIEMPFTFMCFSYFFFPLIGCASSLLLGFTSGIKVVLRETKETKLISEMSNI